MESFGVMLAVGALLVGAGTDLVYRIAQQRGIDAGIFVFWQSVTFTVIIWILAALTDQVTDIRGITWLYGIPAGLTAYVGLTLFVASLRVGDASVNAPVFRLNFVITAVGAIILFQEPLNLLKAAGIILAVVAVLSLINIAALRRAEAANTQSLLMVTAACVLFGVAGLISAAALKEGTGTVPLILTQTVGFQALAAVYLVWNRRWWPNRTTVLFSPGIAVLQIVWSLMLFVSVERGYASVSFPIVQLSFVVTAILAVIFLKEVMSWTKAAGLALATVAVLALAFA